MHLRDLGGLHYPSKDSAVEDNFWMTACAAWERLSSSKDAVDRAVAAAFFDRANEWADMVKRRRGDQNALDNIADEQQ